MAVYTSELDHSGGGADPEVMLQDRLKLGKERSTRPREAFLDCSASRCPGRSRSSEYIRYFCGNTEIADDLKQTEPRAWRSTRPAAAYVRAYANIADDWKKPATPPRRPAAIKDERPINAVLLRDAVRNASGETST
jgi:type I restriction enzyme, R subunit